MKTAYNLFLDDIRIPQDAFDYTKRPTYILDEWVIVRSYEEFIKTITERGMPERISFDHDLGDVHYNMNHLDSQDWLAYHKLDEREKTGYDCAKWLVEYSMDNNVPISKTWHIHSMNPVGGANIHGYITSYLKSLDCACGGRCKCDA